MNILNSNLYLNCKNIHSCDCENVYSIVGKTANVMNAVHYGQESQNSKKCPVISLILLGKSVEVQYI